MEDREVQGKTKLDRVAGGQLNKVGFFVGSEGGLLDLLELRVLGVF